MTKEPYEVIVDGFSVEDNEYFESVARALIDTRLKTPEEIFKLWFYLVHVRSLLYPSLSNCYPVVYFMATKERPECTHAKELPHHEVVNSQWYFLGPTEKTLLEYLYCALSDLYTHSRDIYNYKAKLKRIRDAFQSLP